MTTDSIIWNPSREYLEHSNIARFMQKHDIQNIQDLHEKSVTDISWFWDEALKDLEIEWYQPYTQTISGELPWAQWFLGGKINIVHQCLDRHQNNPEIKNKIALIWEGDCGATQKITYGELFEQVTKVSRGLTSLGITKGDRIGIYMPMTVEMIVAFFAVLKIGAVVVPVFSGFGPEPLAIRLQDAEAKILFTSDGGLRRGKKVSIKSQVDTALKDVPSIQHVIVAKRLFEEIPWTPGRDIWWETLKNENAEGVGDATGGPPSSACSSKGAKPSDGGEERQDPLPLSTPMDSEDTALIIYTSGTTGKPKGCVHTHAGCLAQMTKEVAYYMDCKKDDVFFWLTDIGWMMGPWEFIGVTARGATLVIFEGAPDYPAPDRLWSLVEKHGVSILGMAPTAIRLLKKHDLSHVTKHDLTKLRILGSTGEAWDPESWLWYFENIGGKRCPIINISGGTEIVGCHLSPLPIQPLKPCTLGGPGLGMAVDVVNEEGQSIRQEVGYLVCRKPAPSMTKGFLNDPERYLDTYFSKWPGIWNHGDWAYVDADGFWFLRGRADDVIKVAGHRTGPAEIESVLMEHPGVAECAAIGVPHSIKGESIVCFVVLKEKNTTGEERQKINDDLKNLIASRLGKTLIPDTIYFVPALPKTRSAKIVRGTIKKKFLGLPLGDLSSVENPEALDAIGA